jgi:phosphatidylserine/phosphatidylglycerophosphate/cardiolipin synthase-like enzyme
MTSDDAPAQTIVDHDVAPTFMISDGALDPDFLPTHGTIRSNRLEDGRVWTAPPLMRFYELGRLDSDRLPENRGLPGGGKPYGKLHAKYWTIDSKVSFIGSHNFDPRSRYLNSEVGFFIRSPIIAQTLEKRFSDTVHRSLVWGSPDWNDLIHRKYLKSKERVEDLLETVFEDLPELKSQI